MLENLKNLQKIYTFRDVLRHSRVLILLILSFLTLFSWWLLESGVAWAFDYVWFFALLAVTLFVWKLWPGHSSFRRKKILNANSLIKHGLFSDAYQIYQRLNRLAVFPWEKHQAQLDLAWFLFEVGNHQRAYALAEELAVHSGNLSDRVRVNLDFLLVRKLESAQLYDQALSRLEVLLESVEKPRLRMQIYNNRGRIYTFLHQLDFAQVEYEKSYRLFKQKIEPEFFSVIVHNLLLNYARQGLLDKSECLILEYEKFLDKNNREQWIEYSNDLLHAGREAECQAWIDKAYAIQTKFPPQSEEDVFVFRLSELRMRLNDGKAFNKSYDSFMPKLKVNLEEGKLDLGKKLLIHRELTHVLNAQIAKNIGNQRWLDDYMWLTVQSKQWLPFIDQMIGKINTALPIDKVNWLKAKERLIISSIAFELDLAVLELALKEIVKLQNRVIDLWQDVENVHDTVEEQIVLVDLAITSTTQASCQNEHAMMVRVFRESVESALDNLIEWVTSLQTYHGQEARVIFIAWALLNIRNNKILADKLIKKLHTEQFSLKHYALFVREQHTQVISILRNTCD
ncbi:hypothetical protein [Thiomicrorhabdus sp. Kp2]|uniref:hypothetical protein n=1 Tax=Thiomicrorhabdus sp. Kp2 TaxID=1123518 RepID=UPI00042040AE|nr:hypothetical protein [Thiomicrorhabdus sp. Kp2]